MRKLLARLALPLAAALFAALRMAGEWPMLEILLFTLTVCWLLARVDGSVAKGPPTLEVEPGEEGDIETEL